MVKKKFISKGEGQKFYLLHRSQTDAAYAAEDQPSDFVLVPSKDPKVNLKHHEESHDSIEDNEYEDNLDVKSLLKRGDHIRQDGFKNDGYDYSQHFKEMGGGKFIGIDGKMRETPIVNEDYIKSLNLPPELLPSTGEELDRNLEAIVISDKYMDEDIRNALFNDEDEFGAFEELDDDFVIQAMAEPVEPDFDFDAHIAKLIAASERDLDYVPSRPWDSLKNEISRKVVVNDDEYEEEDDGYEEQSLMLTTEQKEFIESQFEKTLEEYDEDDIGDLEDMDDDNLHGYIDMNSGNSAFEAALDEFLRDQQQELEYDGGGKGIGIKIKNHKIFEKNSLLAEKKLLLSTKISENRGFDDNSFGIDERNGLLKKFDGLQVHDEDEDDDDDDIYEDIDEDDDQHTTLSGDVVVDGDDEDDEEGEVPSLQEENYRKQQLLQQIEEQEKAQAVIDDVSNQVSKQQYDDIFTFQEYLKSEKVSNEWDCETILTTYSVLDNHPRVIKEKNSKFRPHKVRSEYFNDKQTEKRLNNLEMREKILDLNNKNNQRDSRLTVDYATTSNGVGNAIGSSQSTYQSKQIILSNKTHLPIQYSSSKRDKGSDMPTESVILNSHEDDNSDNVEDEQDEEDDSGPINKDKQNLVRSRTETKEEKKLRKQLMKTEKRMKRVMKKEIKSTYKLEESRAILHFAKQQDINHARVFKSIA